MVDITDDMITRVQQLHDQRYAHTMSRRHIQELLTAALDPASPPADEPSRPVCP